MDSSAHPLPVVDCRRVATRQVLLTLDGGSVAESYTVPGQYTRLAFEDGVARPYAIASAPGFVANGRQQLEFLLKVPTDDRVDALCALGTSDKITATRAQGPGFPVDKARGKNLWLFATGSGVAPLRAVLEHILPVRTDFADITLLYGVRTKDELAFTERFGAWAGHGIAVLPVLSRPNATPTPGGPVDELTWNGRTGYVQDHIPKALAHADKHVAFVCGLPEMDKAVAAALLERGVASVYRNF
jgi:NAD(P)H-flavin reductase